MPAIIYDWSCAACGKRHALCLDDQKQAWTNRHYLYQCPSTRQTVHVQTAAWDRVGADRHDGTVKLLPAGG